MSFPLGGLFKRLGKCGPMNGLLSEDRYKTHLLVFKSTYCKHVVERTLEKQLF